MAIKSQFPPRVSLSWNFLWYFKFCKIQKRLMNLASVFQMDPFQVKLAFFSVVSHVYGYVACVYVFVRCVCRAGRGRKTVLDPLGLELQMEWAMWLLRGEHRSTARAARALDHRAISPAPKVEFLKEKYKEPTQHFEGYKIFPVKCISPNRQWNPFQSPS